MQASYSDTVLEPPLEEWVARLSVCNNAAMQRLRQSARRRAVERSLKFVHHLNRLAQESDLQSIAAPLLEGDSDRQPIVMTGHQPTIFHPGLVYKYQQAERFASQTRAIGLAIIIDTDTGDPGAFSFPIATDADNNSLAVLSQPATFGQEASLFPACRLKSAETIREESTSIRAQLLKSAPQSVVDSWTQVASEYSRLDGCTLMEANILVRRLHGIGTGLLELPLSELCGFPEALTLIAGILNRSGEFVSVYNRLLDEFRASHNIRNSANPFPNLTMDSSLVEVPFWVLDRTVQQRYPVGVRRQADSWTLLAGDQQLAAGTGDISAEQLESLIDRNLQLVPRGALITALMRLLISDLFIHGTGGARYDRYTDSLLSEWWDVEPSPFVAASASLFLLADERRELTRLDAVAEKSRDLAHNPQRFLGTGVFTADLESRLEHLLAQKQLAVSRLKEARAAGRSARDIGQQLQQFTNQIRAVVEQEFAPQLRRLESITPANRASVTSRTWPWLLFPEFVQPSPRGSG
jgi:hypothetical protein